MAGRRFVIPEQRGDLACLECAPATLEDVTGLPGLLCLQVELAGLPDELGHVGGLLRIHRRVAAVLDEDLREAVRGDLPVATLHEHRGRMSIQVALAITFRRLTKILGLLVHLGRHALEVGLDVAVRRLRPGLLLSEDRSGRLVVLAAKMQLRGLEEAILVVTNLGGADELAGLDEEAGRGIELIVVPEHLGGLDHLPLLLESVGLLLDLLGKALVGSNVVFLGIGLRRGARHFARLSDQAEGESEQHEPGGQQREAQHARRSPTFRDVGEVARKTDPRIDQQSRERLQRLPGQIGQRGVRGIGRQESEGANDDQQHGERQR